MIVGYELAHNCVTICSRVGMVAIGDKTKWSFSCSTDNVVMGNKKCGLRSIQTLFTCQCVCEMVDMQVHTYVHCGKQLKYFMGVGLCLFVYVHAHCRSRPAKQKHTTTSSAHTMYIIAMLH